MLHVNHEVVLDNVAPSKTNWGHWKGFIIVISTKKVYFDDKKRHLRFLRYEQFKMKFKKSYLNVARLCFKITLQRQNNWNNDPPLSWTVK